jgi:hypothetical protein
MGYIIFNISNCASASETFSGTVTTGVDMILFTATVIGKRPVAILEDISVSVTIPMGTLALQTTALLTRISHELSNFATIMVAGS